MNEENYFDNLGNNLIIPKSNLIKTLSRESLIFYAILIKILISDDIHNNSYEETLNISLQRIKKLLGISRYLIFKYLNELQTKGLIKYLIIGHDKRNIIYKIEFQDSSLNFVYLVNEYKK